MVQVAPPPSAMSPSQQTIPQATLPQGTGAAITPYTLSPTPPSAQNPYALADQLKIRGWVVPLPGAANTVDGGLYGLRNAAAEDGISWLAISSTTFQDNLLRHELPPGNQFGPHSRDLQGYYGQLPTYNTANSFLVNYDLRRYGIPDGQITVGGAYVATNWNPSAPNGLQLAQASYYQTLFHDRVEVKVGLVDNAFEYLGTQIGGNLAGGIFGDNAPLAYENGESPPSFTSAGVNIRVNVIDHIYTKLGVQRALSPDGVLIERDENKSGVRFTLPNAGAFIIDETGYRVPPLPGQMSTWIRAAANYTSSRYEDFTTGERHNANFGLYLLGDRQLLQTAPHAGRGSAVQGVYAGFTVDYAPSYFNIFSQYYELRIYGFGLIPGRPFDQLSLVAGRNVFSEDAVRLERSIGNLAHDNANTFTAAYSFLVSPGINLNLGEAYTDHPTVVTYDQHTGSALNALLNLFVFL